MLYSFDTVRLGRCELERRTSGKNGFGLRKVFCVSALEQPSLARRTFTYVNNAITGVHPVDPSDDTLCRIAIAQFLADLDRCGSGGGNDLLDLNIPPYTGHVSRNNGARLRPASPVQGAGPLSASR